MKYKSLVLSFLVVIFSAKASVTNQFIETQYFRFHNSYWINLHHFLYQKASGNQQRKLNEDNNEFLDIGEKDIWPSLTDDESEKISNALKYYKQNLVKKSLLFDLGALRLKFQQSKELITPDTIISEDFAEILNEASTVYSAKFWPLHKQHNDDIINFHLQAIRELEDTVIPRMEELSQNKWPLENEKVRIDLSAYANFAGAYTPSGEQFNSILSTLDPIANENGFIEIIFHESSHLLFSFGSPFRNAIFFKAKELEKIFPRNLWHACQFYLCGKVIQTSFAQKNTPYELLMDKRNIFSQYNTQNFRVSLDRYMKHEITLEETTNALLKNL